MLRQAVDLVINGLFSLHTRDMERLYALCVDLVINGLFSVHGAAVRFRYATVPEPE